MAALPSTAQISGSHLVQYESFFAKADPVGKGTVGALDAANFLKNSGLSEAILSKIWEVADQGAKGFLDKQGFFAALKLIALVQNGKEISVANLSLQMPPPSMGPPGSPAMAPLGSLGNIWAIKPTEKVKYDQIFEDLKPVNGLLSGDKVRPVLLNSKLPVDILGRVWDLSDLDKDGFLDRDEFAVAMHLVYKALEKEPVPMTLPPDLIPPAKRRKSVVTGGVPVLPMGGISALSDLVPSGQLPLEAAPLTPPVVPVGSITGITPMPTNWVVTAGDKIRFDEMFVQADTDMDGFVNGMEIKDIFLQSGVAQTTLAHIWNLCDTKGMGKLNSDQFALAMYLVQEKLKGVDPPPALTAEMMPPSLRTSALEGAGGIVVDLDTSGVKELDMISKEIDAIKRAKIALEQEKAQKEADIRIQGGEMAALQKELEAITVTVRQLETQKGEAQKRLNELDDKKTKIENQAQEMRDKCEEEQKQIDKLRSQIMSAEMTAKNQEEELKKMRDDLNDLRQEEVELEQKVESGKSQLDVLGNSLTETQRTLVKSKRKVQKLQEMQNNVNECINQYNKLISGDTSVTEPDTSFLSAKDDDDPEPDLPPAEPAPIAASITLTKPAALGSDFKEDPFKSDPFSNTNGTVDPFKDDPFKGSDPFGGSGAFKSDPFGPKPQDTFGGGAFGSTKSDPFGGNDPFGSAFSSTKPAGNDPFDPFGGRGSSGISDMKSPINPDDPFGTGSFSVHAPGDKKGGARDKSPGPSKQKKAPPPPRPPAFKGGPSPAPKRETPVGDLFGGPDPFSASSNTLSANTGGDSFANFADFSPNKQVTSEAEQLAWATRNSQHEWDTQRRLQEQEQADLELAIKLSKQSK